MNNQDLVELIDELKSLVISRDHFNDETVDYITAVVRGMTEGLASINQKFLDLNREK